MKCLFRACVVALVLITVGFPASAEVLDQAATEQLIDRKIKEYVESDAFQQRVEAAIVKFIEKQKQAQAEQERKARDELVKNVAPVDPNTEYVRGPADAAYTLIEYSDYECPYCKRFHNTVVQFIERNSDVNWVYRHFPLSFHNPGAQKEAEAAECAGSIGGGAAFWRYSDLIFERTKSNGKGFPVSGLVPLAVELGLNESAFRECFDSERFKSRVLSQQANGMQSGVSGTPGSFLRHNASGEIVPLGGARPLQMLERVLQQMRDVAKSK